MIDIEIVGWTSSSSNWFEHFYMTRLFAIVLQNIWQYLQYFSRRGLFRESFICCRCQLLRIPNTLWTKIWIFYFLAVSSCQIEWRKTSQLFHVRITHTYFFSFRVKMWKYIWSPLREVKLVGRAQGLPGSSISKHTHQISNGTCLYQKHNYLRHVADIGGLPAILAN